MTISVNAFLGCGTTNAAGAHHAGSLSQSTPIAPCSWTSPTILLRKMYLCLLDATPTIAIQSAHHPAEFVGKKLLILCIHAPMLMLRTYAVICVFDHIHLGLCYLGKRAIILLSSLIGFNSSHNIHDTHRLL